MSQHFVRGLLTLVSWGCESALDVGCGDGRYHAPVPHVETIDGFHRKPVWSARHQLGDALDVLPSIPPGRFDLVYALDVVEHLDKPESARLLDELERVSRRRVVLFTPNGFRPQESENPWQVHRCGWTPDELRERGYHVAVSDFDYGEGFEPLAALWAVKEM